MTCNLVRLRCERPHGETGPDQQAPDFRQLDVPPGRTEGSIRNRYETSSWTVEREEL